MESRQKHLRFIKESEELVKSSQASIQDKMKRKAKFFTATHIEHVRPMFELAWCPMLAAFSVLLEDSEVRKFLRCYRTRDHGFRPMRVMEVGTGGLGGYLIDFNICHRMGE